MSKDGVATALGGRKVLPRWRAPAESIDELTALKAPLPIKLRSGWIEKLQRDFENAPSAAKGRELVESAFVLGVKLPLEIQQATGGLVFHTPRPTPELAVKNESSGVGGIAAAHEHIRAKRAALRKEPAQPLAWTELARFHLSTGEGEKAKKAMQCALALAPQNRYVLRSAARFFDLFGDPDQASHALERSGRLTSDPWLVSAEIALNGVHRSNCMKIGMRMLAEGTNTPRNLTELAAAVGTVEHHHGRHKSAKKMIAQSLLDPNENSIAQAIYISHSDSKIKLPYELLELPLTYEARARQSFADAAWEESMQQSVKWLRDEPFDTRPAQLGSSLCFNPSLTQQAFDIATEGLSCQPNDSLLLNNRAVASAYLGELENAIGDLTQAVKVDADKGYILATFGLIAYRSGRSQLGARAYGMSIASFIKRKDREAAVRGYLYWLRESIRVREVVGTAEIDTVKKIIEKLPQRDTANEMNGLLEGIAFEKKAIAHDPSFSLSNQGLNYSVLNDLEGKIFGSSNIQEFNSLVLKTSSPGIDLARRLSLGLLDVK